MALFLGVPGCALKGTITTVGTIPATCGMNGDNPCFMVWPSRTVSLVFQNSQGVIPENSFNRATAEASVRALPFLQVDAAIDSCRNTSPAATLTVTYTPMNGTSTTRTFTRKDDDHWATRNCGSSGEPSTVTRYDPGFRHGFDNNCYRNEESVGQECITRCADGQIWRMPPWTPPLTNKSITRPTCETP